MATASPESTLVHTDGALKFHVSLNVGNLQKTVTFYRALLGVEPVKAKADYAKFELADPPLVLSMRPTWAGRGGAVNHLGFRVANIGQLEELQRRLDEAGFRTARHDEAMCCYAHQTKFWVSDPDGTLWEIYVFHGDLAFKGKADGVKGLMPPFRALGFVETVRRGLGKSFGALGRLISPRRDGPSPAPAEPVESPAARDHL